MAENPGISVWDREPVLICWRIKTWEHAALDPTSYGTVKRVRDSQRLLPRCFTSDIYRRLAQAEGLIFRWTEPLAPLEARLLRDTDAEDNLRLEAEVSKLFSAQFAEVIPNWEATVHDKLGSRISKIERQLAASSYTLGVPRDEFSLSYGYELQITRFNNCDSFPSIPTHRTLLVGCHENVWQPGLRRDLIELLR